MSKHSEDRSTVQNLTREIVSWFQTASLDRRSWAADAQLDVWQPVIRLQASGVDEIEAAYRSSYPQGQEVTWSTGIATERGVLVELTIRSRDPERRFAKECAVIETDDAGRIAHLRIHCTGEWPAALEQAFVAAGGSLDLDVLEGMPRPLGALSPRG